jgi:hypothetical protein
MMLDYRHIEGREEVFAQCDPKTAIRAEAAVSAEFRLSRGY